MFAYNQMPLLIGNKNTLQWKEGLGGRPLTVRYRVAFQLEVIIVMYSDYGGIIMLSHFWRQYYGDGLGVHPLI